MLFRCDWFYAYVDEYGLTRVNFNKLCYKNDPFVLASQVHQVFYVQDLLEYDIHYVMKRVPRDFFDFEELNPDTYWKEPVDSGYAAAENLDTFDIGVGNSREGVNVRTVDIDKVFEVDQNIEEHDSDYDDTD